MCVCVCVCARACVCANNACVLNPVLNQNVCCRLYNCDMVHVDECQHRWIKMAGWMDGSKDGWMDGWMDR